MGAVNRENNNHWRDECFTSEVLFLIVTILPIIPIFCGIVMVVRLVFIKQYVHLYDMALMFVVFSSVLSWMLYVVSVHRKTLKLVFLMEGRIEGLLYYNVPFSIRFDDIKSVTAIKENYFIKNMRTFTHKEKGFDINLKSGCTYHVSPFMTDRDGLKSMLTNSNLI